MGKLDGRYAVVTGGGRGIGEKIVERFAAEGAAGIAVLDVNLEKAGEVANSLGNGGRYIAIKCDVSDREMVEAVFKQVLAEFGRIDILVNNAGITRDAMFHKMTVEQWDDVLDVNLKGAFLCMRQVVDGMREQNYGKIVNVSSSSVYGNIGQGNYSAAKAGMMGLTATTALELARKNITVNSVLPGTIETDMLREVPEDIRNRWRAGNPFGRFGTPEELASCVLFLSCDDSSYVSGVSLICGGAARIAF